MYGERRPRDDFSLVARREERGREGRLDGHYVKAGKEKEEEEKEAWRPPQVGDLER